MSDHENTDNQYTANYAVRLDSRVARLEVGVDYLQREMRDVKSEMRDMKRELRGDIVALSDKQEKDFRLLFAMNAATTLGLAGLMAKGFGWLN